MNISREDIKSLIREGIRDLKEYYYERPKNDFRHNENSLGMSDEDRNKMKWEDLKSAVDESDEFYIELLKVFIDAKEVFMDLLCAADEADDVQEDVYFAIRGAEENRRESEERYL